VFDQCAAFFEATADAEQFVATPAAPRSKRAVAAAGAPDTLEGTR
jgi:hypothetical protein